ncbi:MULTISPECIES: hypothetical protein [unclassified Actinobaculum]|uniref:hypothetical protein n=1 Tax=unclassified Actinobaculum TaxID=2609299 RepID=UPI000D5257ED|nr:MULTISPECIES: hypothetical protein [unclassified Actinobaculum]AWE43189.1 hypothetical protein DDD63_11040 [Actinobaculum sp. 313]RTE47638.1 hypothetical protein EKN07_12330 [Actinobaculum sp. 352]
MDPLQLLNDMLSYQPDMEDVIHEIAELDPSVAIRSLLDALYDDRIQISPDLLHRLGEYCDGSYYLEESYRDLAELQKELAADAA